MIRNGLKGMSQDPQVLVSVDQSVTNSVVMAGEVSKPGRFVVVTNRETLNDTIALAGGYKGEPKDLVARVERDGRDFEIRLSDLMDLPQRDLSIAPGDRITLISRPQSFCHFCRKVTRQFVSHLEAWLIEIGGILIDLYVSH